MKQYILSLVCIGMLLTACSHSTPVAETTIPETVPVTTVPVTTVPVTTVPVTTVPATIPPTDPETPPAIEEPVLTFTEEEQNMLLKLGMAERGNAGCTECIALVMCTVLNRVEADRFGSSVRSVILAPEQFTPVMDGSYEPAEPNQLCYDALQMVIHGWDESQGALFYEWCDGPSWHSKNLHLLFQHCDVRFYD